MTGATCPSRSRSRTRSRPPDAKSRLWHNARAARSSSIFENRKTVDEPWEKRRALCVAAENVAGVKDIKDHLVWVEPVSGMAFDASYKEPTSSASPTRAASTGGHYAHCTSGWHVSLS